MNLSNILRHFTIVTLKSYDNEKLKVKVQSVLIEKVGWIKIKEQLPIEGKYTNPRISHDGKYWYLCVGVEQEFEQPILSNESLGVDVGIKHLAVCSDGTVFKNINKSQTVRKLEKRLRRLQKQVSRRVSHFSVRKNANLNGFCVESA